ncbi:MAG: ABC transporter permease [Cyclobacteriaceae bacterium]|nr:ABC transporter permease [Cyclobacteriaceae bacterium]
MNKHTPPKWADKFLSWYCRPDLLEEIQGDVYELFERTAKENQRRAKWLFVWNVLRFFRWKNIRLSKPTFVNSYFILLTNYMRVGIRSANRHRLNSTINVIGLSIAIGVSVTAGMFIDNQLNSYAFQKNADRVFEITSLVKTEDGVQEWGDTPLMLGPELRESSAGVVGMTRINTQSASARTKDGDAFYEQVSLVDPDFHKLFSLTSLQGDITLIRSKNTIVINQEQAIKYFGDQNPIGQVLSLKFNSGTKNDFTVVAVVEEPINSAIYFGFIISIKHLEIGLEEIPAWQKNTGATFVLLQTGYPASGLQPALIKYKELQNRSSPNWKVEEFLLRPLPELATNSKQIINSVSHGANQNVLIALGIVSILLLLTSCFNYINVAVATITIRVREIAVRKVIGGSKKEIVQQFLTENVIICLMATGVGVLLAYILFLPALRNLTPIEVPFQFSSWQIGVMYFVSLIFFVCLLSGLYPAFYVASFAPAQILKGKQKFGHQSGFSKSLLTLQFMLTIIMVVASLMFIQNAISLKNRDWGYSYQHVVTIFTNSEPQYAYLNTTLQANTKVKSIAGTVDHVGMDYNWKTISVRGTNVEAMHYRIGFNYLETLNLKLLAGRYFNSNLQSDKIESAVITQSLADLAGWDNGLNQTLVLDSNKYFVVGIVQDFLYDAWTTSAPAFFTISSEEKYNYITASVAPELVNEALLEAKSNCHKIAPDDPFEGFRQEDVFRGFLDDLQINIQLLIFVSIVAILISCLGLYGLVAFSITRRLKEFSIRKIFGANLLHIANLMSKDYVWVFSVAFLIGLPVGNWLINSFIEELYHVTQSISTAIVPSLCASIILLIMFMITLGLQLNRVTKENPSETLKIE